MLNDNILRKIEMKNESKKNKSENIKIAIKWTN